jgi:aminomethyltransferase
VQYSCLPNNDGGIVDDLLVYRLEEEQYCLVVNASNISKDWDWISAHNDMGADMKNISDHMSLLAVQGPKAVEALQSLTSVDLKAMDYYTCQYGDFAGKETVLISATGYTGSGGFEIYVKNDEAVDVWNAVLAAGESHGMVPCGLAARDTLRLEMGFCLYGNDIDDSTSPIEAGLSWITKFTKDFVNSDALQAQKKAGITRRLIGFEMLERGIPRKDYDIVDADGKSIGRVTSGTMSPSLDKAIGMGYVDAEHKASGTEIYIQVRQKRLKAQVVKMPFYKNPTS